MKTFAEIEIDTAALFFEAFEVEPIVYVKTAGRLQRVGIDAATAAAGGIFDDDVPIAATDGILQPAPVDLETRNIMALVNRPPVERLGSPPHGSSAPITIAVENNSSSGISSAEIDLGHHCVEIAVRQGESRQRRKITAIKSQDPGMMQLEIK